MNVFILTGGGSRGALQVGMLKKLIELSILPDLIVGISVGSLNGIVIASNPSLETVNDLEEIWKGVVEKELFPVNVKQIIAGLGKNNYLVSNSGLKKLISKSPVRNIEDPKIKFLCVVTNFETGQSVIFDKGKAEEILLASCSLPGIFEPVNIEGQLYIDGGICFLPINDLPGVSNKDTIYILDASSPIINLKHNNALSALLKSLSMTFKSQFATSRDLDNVYYFGVDKQGNEKLDGKSFSSTIELVDKGYSIVSEVLLKNSR